MQSGLESNEFVTCFVTMCVQVHVVLSEVATDHISANCNMEDSDFSDDEDYDLSDTDNEDEWNTPQAV